MALITALVAVVQDQGDTVKHIVGGLAWRGVAVLAGSVRARRPTAE